MANIPGDITDEATVQERLKFLGMNLSGFDAEHDMFEKGSLPWSMQNMTFGNDTDLSWLGPFGSYHDPVLARFNAFLLGMDTYFVPIICIVGAVGNLLAFVVFVASHLRRLSSSVYLASLSLSDLGYLMCVIIKWASQRGLDLDKRQGWCQVLAFMRHVWVFLSMWSIVSFTCERYILVCCPFRRQSLCTTKRAKVVIVCLAAVAGTLYSYTLFTFSVHTIDLDDMGPGGMKLKICAPSYLPNMIVDPIINILNTVITLFIPFFTILVLNARIMYAVAYVYKKRQKEMRQMVHQFHDSERSFMNQATTTSTLNRYQVKVTKMLVIVSTTFLVLNFPIHVIRIHTLVLSLTNSTKPSLAVILTEKLFMNMFYVNFAINIFLYSAYGRNFKRATKQVYRRVKHNMTRCLTKSCCLRMCALYYRNNEPDWLTVRVTKDIRATFL